MQDHKHPPGLLCRGTLCPRIPARGQWSIQDAVHILSEVQQAGKGSIVSFCSCILLVKCHIQLRFNCGAGQELPQEPSLGPTEHPPGMSGYPSPKESVPCPWALWQPQLAWVGVKPLTGLAGNALLMPQSSKGDAQHRLLGSGGCQTPPPLCRHPSWLHVSEGSIPVPSDTFLII